MNRQSTTVYIFRAIFDARDRFHGGYTIVPCLGYVRLNSNQQAFTVLCNLTHITHFEEVASISIDHCSDYRHRRNRTGTEDTWL